MRKPQRKGTAMPEIETLRGRSLHLRDELEIGLHAGEEKQHQHAELTDPVDHAALRRVARKKRASALGQTAPRTEVPTRMPASNCPMIAG